MKTVILILPGLAFFFCLYGQTFEQTLSGYYYNQDFPGRNILVTEEGDYIMAGKSLAINGLNSLTLTMFHKSGTRLWTSNFETGEYVNFRMSVEKTEGAGFFVFASGPYLTRIIQADQAGRRLWTKSISYGRYEDNGPLLLNADSAGFLLCGTRVLGPEKNHQRIISLRSVDTSGNIYEEKFIRSDRHLTLQSVIKTSDRGWLISGRNGFTYPEGSNLFLARTNQEGDTLWTREFDEITNLMNSSVCQLKNKQFIVAGTYLSEISFKDRIIKFVT